MSEPIDGILGMSRDRAPPTDNSYQVGPLLVKALSAASLTQFDVFSFNLASPDRVSFIDFNGFDVNNIKGGSDQSIVWLKLIDDFFWSSYCQGISFGTPGATDYV
jgi:hypothetical protein